MNVASAKGFHLLLAAWNVWGLEMVQQKHNYSPVLIFRGFVLCKLRGREDGGQEGGDFLKLCMFTKDCLYRRGEKSILG